MKTFPVRSVKSAHSQQWGILPGEHREQSAESKLMCWKELCSVAARAADPHALGRRRVIGTTQLQGLKYGQRAAGK